MALVSLPYLIFVSATVLLYFLAPKKVQWVVLLIASYVYFWLNSKRLVLVLFASTLATFLAGLRIESINRKGKQTLKESTGLSREEKKALKEATKKRSKVILTVGVVFDLSILLFLKYFNFFASNVKTVVSLTGKEIEVPVLHLLLPLGISYYTLQAIAYLFDIYRNKCSADHHLPRFMLFMSYFPQIIQGPIPRYRQLANQLYEGHSFDYKRFCFGAQLMLWGWMKKLIIADRIAIAANEIFDNSAEYSGALAFFGAVCYGFQVYTDFSGGVDIVRGVSQMLGIELEQNFRQPYFAKSIEEFWRRWHITLGAWMRDYVFYPLSLSPTFGNLSKKSRKLLGNSVGKKLPSFLAMYIVYFLVGFWHGSSWKYFVFGFWNGNFIVISILLSDVYEKLHQKLHIDPESFSWRLFQMLRTFVICSFGRFFSRAARLQVAWSMFRSVFHHWWDISFLVDGSLLDLGLDTANWVLLLIAIGVVFLVDYIHERDVHIREAIAGQGIVFRWIVYIAAVLCVLIFGIYGPMYEASSFIYGQF